MQIIQSSLARAVSAIIMGVLLIKYREQTVTWLTIVIGILFFLSGVISCAAYFVARRRESDVQLFDAEGRQLSGFKVSFPLTGLGSIVLGLILALMPNAFISWLMFILAAILIIGAIGQFVSLATIARTFRVGIYFWIMPSVILLVGLLALIRPSAIASAPLFVIGWCMLLYGVSESVNSIKFYLLRKKMKETDEKKVRKTKASSPKQIRNDWWREPFNGDAPLFIVWHNALDILAYNAYALQIVASLRYDDIGITLRRLNELLVHRLENFQISVNNHRHSASAVYNVALYVAYQTLVAVAIYKYLQIHHIPQLLVQKGHYALDYNHRFRFHMHRFRQSVALQIRICGLFHRSTLTQFVDVFYEQFPVECIRMVEVYGMTLLLSHVRRVVIIRVERHHSHMMRRQRLHNLLHNGGFS